MTGIFIDTSAYSAFKRGHAGVRARLREFENICLNPIVIGELLAGFLRGGKDKENREALEAFLSSSRVQLLEISRGTAERYAVIQNALRHSGTPIPTNDLWIAASVMEHGLKLVTMDGHFRQVPQIVSEVIDVSE
jgi:tRNA(fMet)-specific endonuclease VapC